MNSQAIYRLRKVMLIGFLLFLSIQLSANETDSTSRLSWFDRVYEWYTANMNYGTITALMAAESSIFPVPSELVVPPAAFIASRGDGGMKMIWVIVFATIGAWIGATVNYFILGMWLGRNIIYKFADSRLGRMLLLSSEKLKRSENFFNKYGIVSTFIGRFIPIIRHFISIPAGFSKMNYFVFSVFTLLGAGLWNCILAFLGRLANGQQEVIYRYSHEIGYGLLAIVCLVIVFLVMKYFVGKSKKTNI